MINKTPVCESCYCSIIGLSHSSWASRKNECNGHKLNWEHGNIGREVAFSAAGFASRMWMKDYFETLGDWQPDTGQLHLPPTDKADVYLEMAKELGDTCVGKLLFQPLLQRRSHHVPCCYR